MAIKKNHIRIGNYVIQHSNGDKYGRNRGFVVLDTTQGNAQIGYAYDHLCDALEEVLLYED